MHTGDLATMDAEGYVNIVGRIKDMVIRGGENIYPREVEEFLYHHPAVSDVQVIGVPDKKYGEELCAWIILKGGQQASGDDIRAFCEGKIAHYKVPRHIRFVESFPMTITGKVHDARGDEARAEYRGREDGLTNRSRAVLAELKSAIQIGRTFIDRCNELDSQAASMAKYWCSDLQGKVRISDHRDRRIRERDRSFR
jgi:hypothetical protein